MIGSPAANAAGFTGKGVIVAVMDSPPKLDHIEYAARHLDSYNIYTGKPTNSPPDDDVGHGTHVSGTVGGKTVGVAPEVNLIAIDLFPEDWKEIVAAGGSVEAATDDGNLIDPEEYGNSIRWAAASGARIINNSWGVNLYPTDPGADAWVANNPIWVEALREVSQAGVVTVWANGNQGGPDPSVDAALPYYLPEVQKTWITVASVGPDGKIADYSDRCGVAAQWCISAPGGGDTVEGYVLSAFPGNLYVPLAGTSMAAPAVSGSVAIGMQMFPDASSADVVQLVLRTAEEAGDPGVDPIYGWGRLSVQNLVSTIDPITTSLVGNAAWSRFTTMDSVESALRQRVARYSATGLPEAPGSDGVVWALPFAGRSVIDASASSRSARSSVFGILAGAEIYQNDNWNVGAGLGFSQTALRESGVEDSGDANGLHGVVYASFRSGAWFSELNGQVASFDQDLERRTISGTARAAVKPVGRSSYRSTGYQADFRLGRDIVQSEARRITAFAELGWMSQSSRAFHEQDAGVFAISADKSTLDRQDYGLGVRWTEVIERESGLPLTAVTDLSLVSGDGDLDNASTVTLLNRPIKVATADFQDTVAVLSGSIDLPLDYGRAYVGYDAAISNPEESLSVSLGFEMRF